MEVLDFVLDNLFIAFNFLRNTVIFGVSLFNWILGFSVCTFILDCFLGGDDSAN